MNLKFPVRFALGRFVRVALVLTALGCIALAADQIGSPNTPVGSKEPIITMQDNPTPVTGIGGSLQAPAGTQPPALVAGNYTLDTVTYVTFVVRPADWAAHPNTVPTTRPTGILGAFTDTWIYDGSVSPNHSFHFNVASTQEGESFFVVVKTTTGTTTTYRTTSVTIGRAN